jgi:alpha-glucosidase (family GH31 glycosyl hydrolase)
LRTDPNVRDNTLGIPAFGQAIAINLSGTPSWSLKADLAGFEGNNNPDGVELIVIPTPWLCKMALFMPPMRGKFLAQS